MATEVVDFHEPRAVDFRKSKSICLSFYHVLYPHVVSTIYREAHVFVFPEIIVTQFEYSLHIGAPFKHPTERSRNVKVEGRVRGAGVADFGMGHVETQLRGQAKVNACRKPLALEERIYFDERQEIDILIVEAHLGGQRSDGVTIFVVKVSPLARVL